MMIFLKPFIENKKNGGIGSFDIEMIKSDFSIILEVHLLWYFGAQNLVFTEIFRFCS